MSRPLQALVAIQYDDGETHVWKLTQDVLVDEHFNMVIAGEGAGLPHFDLLVQGNGRRTDVTNSEFLDVHLVVGELGP